MVWTTKKNCLAIILISLWTIFQSLFHLFWVVSGYLLATCRLKPSYYNIVFIYLTYFYKKSCGPIVLDKEKFFPNKIYFQPYDVMQEKSWAVLYRFLDDTLHNGTLPQQSNLLPRTEMYLVMLFISDIAWIIAAVFLFVCAFEKFRRKSLSLIFYGPWLICTGFIIFLDVVSAVHYGLDLVHIESYTSWLKFMGVSNYADFQSYDSEASSSVMPTLPSTLIVTLLSRIFFVWLLNVVCFFAVLFFAIPDVFTKVRSIRRGSTLRSSHGKNTRIDSRQGLDFNTSEARIRNWQLFYGAIEANSTMASSSNIDPSSSRSNGNSGKRVKIEKDEEETFGSLSYNSPRGCASLDCSQSLKMVKLHSKSLTFLTPEKEKTAVINGHVPWSYIDPKGQYMRRPLVNEPKPKSDHSDFDCTKL